GPSALLPSELASRRRVPPSSESAEAPESLVRVCRAAALARHLCVAHIWRRRVLRAAGPGRFAATPVARRRGDACADAPEIWNPHYRALGRGWRREGRVRYHDADGRERARRIRVRASE